MVIGQVLHPPTWRETPIVSRSILEVDWEALGLSVLLSVPDLLWPQHLGSESEWESSVLKLWLAGQWSDAIASEDLSEAAIGRRRRTLKWAHLLLLSHQIGTPGVLTLPQQAQGAWYILY